MAVNVGDKGSPLAPYNGTFGSASLYSYFDAVLTELGAPSTYDNFLWMAAWSACEGPPGSQGGYNPLNTTLKTSNVLPGNAGFLGNDPNQNGGNPVKNYDGWHSGVTATVQSIGPGIKGQLVSGTPGNLANMIGSSHWGTDPVCVASKAADFKVNPANLAAWLAQPVNTNSTNQGGSGATADTGKANPESDLLPTTATFGGLVPALGTLLSDITSGTWWKRVGIGVLGTALLVGGLILFVSTTGTGKKIESTAELAAVA